MTPINTLLVWHRPHDKTPDDGVWHFVVDQRGNISNAMREWKPAEQADVALWAYLPDTKQMVFNLPS